MVSFLLQSLVLQWLYFALYFLCIQFSKGTLIIDDKGITDDTKDNLSINFKWEGINLIIIYKDILMVIGNSALFILVKLDDKEKVRKEILKYCDEEKCVFN